MPKRVGYLYDKMLDKEFIRGVILSASTGRKKRSDIAKVLADLDRYVDRTFDLLSNDSYVPAAPRERDIYDSSSGKIRHIQMLPFWPDAVIQWLCVEAMKPVMMRGMYSWSCASIPKRGTQRVRKRIRHVMDCDPKGTRYAAELDIKHYYPSIPKRKLIWALARKIKDKRFLRLVYSIIDSCGEGIAIGFYICQWLANFYLEPLDHYIMTLPGVKYMTRYMDNIVLFGPNKKQLHRARVLIEDFLRTLGLQLNENWQVYRTSFTKAAADRWAKLDERKQRLRKPRMVSAVGYRFSHTHTILRKKAFLRLTRACRKAGKKLRDGKPISHRLAAGLISRIGALKHCNGFDVTKKYVDPVGISKLKAIVRAESRKRVLAA